MQYEGWIWTFQHSVKGLVEGKYVNDKSNITIRVEDFFGSIPPDVKSIKVNNVEMCENGVIEVCKLYHFISILRRKTISVQKKCTMLKVFSFFKYSNIYLLPEA